MNARTRSFIAANEVSPIVYGAVDKGKVTYRLANGKTFRLNSSEARQIPQPRWEHQILREYRAEEHRILTSVLAEEAAPEMYPEGGR